MRAILEKLITDKNLKPKEIEQVFAQMLKGELNEATTAAFLVAWRFLGENVELLLAGAKQLRAHSKKLALPNSLRPLGDNCGTGGSGFAKFNVSTAAAIVAASLGARVAKHGNRSVSGVCGSADVLFAAGLKDQLSDEKTSALLENFGFCFFFAPQWHPQMKHVMPARKNMGIRTIFNLLGPLANPLAPEFQLLGVARKELLMPMAQTLLKLGVKKALVVHSQDGLDEISISAPTNMLLIEKKKITRQTFFPEKLKIKGKKKQLASNGVEENLALLKATFAGEKTRVQDAVAINAAALLWLMDKTESLKEGFLLTKKKLESKEVLDFFNCWLKEANAP